MSRPTELRVLGISPNGLPQIHHPPVRNTCYKRKHLLDPDQGQEDDQLLDGMHLRAGKAGRATNPQRREIR